MSKKDPLQKKVNLKIPYPHAFLDEPLHVKVPPTNETVEITRIGEEQQKTIQKDIQSILLNEREWKK